MRNKITFFFSFLFIFLCPGQEFFHLKDFGTEYNFIKLTDIRPVRIHILKIDLSKNNVELKVIPANDPDGKGPAEAELTDPVKLFEKEKNGIAFINANPWDSLPDRRGNKNRKWYKGQFVEVMGLVASNGKIYSEPEPIYISVFIDKYGRLNIANSIKKEEVIEGAAGFSQLVKDGNIVIKKSDLLNPLTGIGVDKTGYKVFFVVIDGRQRGFSEGMTLYELAEFMLKLGCWNVAQMDGGGSSIMGVRDNKGKIVIVNSPSDKRIRPLPVILAVKIKK